MMDAFQVHAHAAVTQAYGWPIRGALGFHRGLHASYSPESVSARKEWRGSGDERGMSQSGLDAFGGYRKARQLFDLVVKDMEVLKTNPLCYRLVSQQIAARIRSVPTSKRVMGGSAGLSTFVSSTSHEALLVRRVGATNG